MSSNGAVAIRDGSTTTALAIRPGQEMFNDKQRAALAVLGIKDATNADLAVYMHYCQRTGLDPFARQIYMIMRREKQGDRWVAKQTIQVGIDGFRVIRDRAARRDGVTVDYEDTVWYDGDGGAHAIWLWDHAPTACKVVAVKHTPTGDLRYPGVLRTNAYMATKDGKPVSQWKTQPDHMIEKCCEAFALRRAFPNDLGGVYLDDEMPPMAADAQRGPQRVTRADIVERRPAEADPTPAPDAGDSGSTNGPAPSEPARPAKRRQSGADKLMDLVRTLPLGTEEDVAALFRWQLGQPYNGDVGHVRHMTSYLRGHLEACQGDVAEAASAIWTQYNAVNTQDAAAEGSQDEVTGDAS